MVALVPIAPNLALQHDSIRRRKRLEFLDGPLTRNPQVVNLHRANADVLEQDRPLARLFQRRRIWIFPPHRQDRCVRDGKAAQQLMLDGPIDMMRHETRN